MEIESVGPMVQVEGVVKAVLPDDLVRAKHQCFVLDEVQVKRVAGASGEDVAKTLFCSVRYGDDIGKERVIGLSEGAHVEIQGEYLQEPFPSSANPWALPVIHCAHRPFGYVKVEDNPYQ